MGFVLSAAYNLERDANQNLSRRRQLILSDAVIKKTYPKIDQEFLEDLPRLFPSLQRCIEFLSCLYGMDGLLGPSSCAGPRGGFKPKIPFSRH
jgi:hypothetical protein